MKEEYKAKKLEELESWAGEAIACEGTYEGDKMSCLELGDAKKLLSQTIDELYGCLPEVKDMEQYDSVNLTTEEAKDYRVCWNKGLKVGWNDCIAEAGRMRDNQLSEKR